MTKENSTSNNKYVHRRIDQGKFVTCLWKYKCVILIFHSEMVEYKTEYVKIYSLQINYKMKHLYAITIFLFAL